MVKIAPPPPEREPNPLFHELAPGSRIVRIFDPTRYGTQALTFRINGPRVRFDHHRFPQEAPQDDCDRGIYYAAPELSSCLVEIFGDTGIIEIQEQCIAYPTVTRSLQLLDLRNSGAMKAGSVAALSQVPERDLSQAWSRYFYEQVEIYSRIDGIIYFNAHNYEEAIALYERAKDGLSCTEKNVIRLDHLALRPYIQEGARKNNLIFLN